jgi:hypothetical protein
MTWIHSLHGVCIFKDKRNAKGKRILKIIVIFVAIWSTDYMQVFSQNEKLLMSRNVYVTNYYKEEIAVYKLASVCSLCSGEQIYTDAVLGHAD